MTFRLSNGFVTDRPYIMFFKGARFLIDMEAMG
jgi:hypothetical protein